MLLTQHDLIAICHRCPFRGKPEAGRMECTINGRDIIENTEKGECPKGFYSGVPFPIAPPIPSKLPTYAGDMIATVTHAFGIDRAAKLVAKIMGKPDCGCAKRREWMNRLDRRLRSRVHNGR